jgi:hypothetical protein
MIFNLGGPRVDSIQIECGPKYQCVFKGAKVKVSRHIGKINQKVLISKLQRRELKIASGLGVLYLL